MATKRTSKKSIAPSAPYGTPNYPYSSMPSSLGRFLSMVPTKPKPEKVNPTTLKAWGFRNTNDQSILRVLKALEFLSPTGEPTSHYEEFMQSNKGPAALGRQIRKVYPTLFSTVSNPGNAPHDELRSFFNTYGGGSEKVVQLQIQTFKAMAGYATFGASDPLEQTDKDADGRSEGGGPYSNGKPSGPAVRIDLHIHLPENKTKADYDSILESIAKHLYGTNL